METLRIVKAIMVATVGAWAAAVAASVCLESSDGLIVATNKVTILTALYRADVAS